MRHWKRLSETDVLRICTIIDEWPLPSITWDAPLGDIEIQLTQKYSRQALDRKVLIKEHFQARKDKKPELLRMNEADQTIQRLRLKVDALEETVQAYDLRFMRHVGNALRWKKNPEDLDRPLPGEA